MLNATRLAGNNRSCTNCVDLVKHFCRPRRFLFLPSLSVWSFLLEDGHNLSYNGGIHVCHAFFHVLLVLRAVLVVVILTRNSCLEAVSLGRKSPVWSALASRCMFFILCLPQLCFHILFAVFHLVSTPVVFSYDSDIVFRWWRCLWPLFLSMSCARSSRGSLDIPLFGVWGVWHICVVYVAQCE